MKSILLIVLILSFNNLLPQNVSFMQTNGPAGGTIASIISAVNGILIAGGSGGTYLSTNEGNSWTHTGQMEYFISKVLRCSNGNIVSGGTNGIKYSSNNGNSWQSSTLGASNPVNDIVKLSNGKLFAATSNGVYKSTDNGISWALSGVEYNNLMTIAASPSGILFTGGNTFNVFRSTDEGQTWQSTLFGQNVNSMAATSNGYVFIMVNTGSGLYASVNNGNTWMNVTLQTGVNTPNYLSVINGTKLFALTELGLMLSTDFGGTWSNGGLTNLQGKRFIDSIGAYDYVCSFSGVWKTPSGITQWNPANTGIVNNDVRAMIYNSQYIFAGTANNGVYRSSDMGGTWESLGLEGNEITDFDFGSSGTILYVGAKNGGPFKSTNNGTNWQPCNYGQPSGSYSVRANPNYDFYSCSPVYGTYRLASNGSGWYQYIVQGQNPLSYDIAFQSSANIFICVVNQGIKRSLNSGTNWDFANSGLLSNNILKVAVRGGVGTLFCIDSTRIYRSLNNGTNWTPVYTTTGRLNSRPVFNSAGHIFVASDEGVLYSYNNGDNWYVLNNGLLPGKSHAITVSVDNYLYCGTDVLGIFRSSLPIGIRSTSTEVPSEHSLGQNYPNPFNASTVLRFSISNSSSERVSGGDLIQLIVYDINGRKVQSLVNQRLQPGSYEVTFDGSNLPSGVYICKMSINGKVYGSKRMVMLK